MIRQLGELIIDTSADYKNEVVTALEKAGFVIVLSRKTLGQTVYIVAKEVDEEWG